MVRLFGKVVEFRGKGVLVNEVDPRGRPSVSQTPLCFLTVEVMRLVSLLILQPCLPINDGLNLLKL